MKTYCSSKRERSKEKKMILPDINYNVRAELYVSRFLAVLVAVLVLTFAGMTADAAVKQKQKGFATPEEAVKAIMAAARNNDDKELIAIFGPSAKDLIFSGDPVADKERREKLLKAYDEKNSLVAEKGGMVIVIGNNDWPFPIPLVKKGDIWSFDTARGREEVLNRRIGENELSTIQTMLAIVDAEREYAMKDYDGNGTPEYAQKFFSDPGKKNGLYWETKEGEEPSPMGPLVAQAKQEGYKKSGGKPIPYHGYYFRALTAQGKNATGGAFDYVVKGHMIGGFAVIATPAIYGNSGVMTFLVNHDGVVYQKDLGKKTEQTAKSIKKFDPDKTWKKVE
jgi:hypothetical protein